MAISVKRIERIKQEDPADRPKLFVEVCFQHDQEASKKLSSEGRQTSPVFNGWSILKNWENFIFLLREYGMTEQEIYDFKLKIENT